ncbi:hypothetical protein PsorP6_012395 [Peronosclerospora sorghi]|uniref:Uncharacterized protein n=1 Tax=Peronosclerospora sorghi TaxID=230839 RepID=A0ACC0WEE1_9STRA|nr:hypothetical protein PsorP6_012395 [Peronosclerospora sorghi]
MKLFRDLVESSFISIEDESNRISSTLCQSLLATLHTKMTEKVDGYLMSNNPKAQDSSSFQSTEFKRFYHIYQTNLFELKAEYTDQAKGPAKVKRRAFQIPAQSHPATDCSILRKTGKVRQHDVDVVEKWIQRKEVEIEEFNTMQRMYQKQAMDAQENVNTQLVEKAKLQAHAGNGYKAKKNYWKRMRSSRFVTGCVMGLTIKLTQVQLPEQNVIKSSQDNKVSELQGYLIKQGGGGNVLSLLGRKNWKQRYFILSGTNLIYAKTKDDYERGKIIKELSLTGWRGLFEKNNKKRSSSADNGRIFKLRAQNINNSMCGSTGYAKQLEDAKHCTRISDELDFVNNSTTVNYLR